MRIQIDSSICRGCEACQLACSLIHEGVSNPLLARLRVTKDMEHYLFNVVLCEQCHTLDQVPACIDACPSEAIIYDNRNVVILLEDVCLQCGSCKTACSYQAIFFNEADNRYHKCNLCTGRERLACVEICPVGALTLDEQAHSGDSQ